MLSSGTRIGPYRIKSWVREGSCGQSYIAECSEGENKGETHFLKLIPREIAETERFEEIFFQECQVIQQLEGEGIWPIIGFGQMKWKSWIAFDLFSGRSEFVPKEGVVSDGEDSALSEEVLIKTLHDELVNCPHEWTERQLFLLMESLHLALHKAHSMGIAHGNLKPRNILIKKSPDGDLKAWVSEFGLFKLTNYACQEISDLGDIGIARTTTLDAQESSAESSQYRPLEEKGHGIGDERWDLYAIGEIAKQVVSEHLVEGADLKPWWKWINQAVSTDGFENISESLSALPGVIDLSKYGIKHVQREEKNREKLEEIRKRREKEWQLEQQILSLRFRKKMTGFIGGLFVFGYLLKSIYLAFWPTPWTEYSLQGASDRYQFGIGLFSGRAWGVLPAQYDKKREGGSNVVGEWKRENGLLKLSFRKFKGVDQKDEDKKLWQFIGKGATTPDDYYSWSDYLKYLRASDQFVLVKRTDGQITYLPASKEGDYPRLFPEKFVLENSAKLKKANIVFSRIDSSGPSWELFLGIGFLLACSLYSRSLRRLLSENKKIATGEAK